MKFIRLLLFLVLIPGILFSREQEDSISNIFENDTLPGLARHDHDIDPDADHEHLHRHNFEIGFGAGWVRLLKENENAAGFHFHFLKSLGEKQRFSVGPGFEFIADEHAHASAVISLGYRPVHPLMIGISPGISFLVSGNDGQNEAHFTTHFEVLYEFEFDFIHIGPMLEYSWAGEDRHFILAVHLGFNF